MRRVEEVRSSVLAESVTLTSPLDLTNGAQILGEISLAAN